jgi:tRNA modification GTPase
VADLIDAETEAQRRQALGQIGGALSQRYDRWREILIQALAMLEAAVDFPDEDLPEEVAARARPASEPKRRDRCGLDDVSRGRRVRDGFRIALVGAPNAGKSTLLNGLAERDAAIVTDTPGTTRDIIEVPMVLGGYKVCWPTPPACAKPMTPSRPRACVEPGPGPPMRTCEFGSWMVFT